MSGPMEVKDGNVKKLIGIAVCFSGKLDDPPVIRCSVCLESMTDPDSDMSAVGIEVSLEGVPQACVPRHLVPFRYKICWSCWLESLGIKPNLPELP